LTCTSAGTRIRYTVVTSCKGLLHLLYKTVAFKRCFKKNSFMNILNTGKVIENINIYIFRSQVQMISCQSLEAWSSATTGQLTWPPWASRPIWVTLWRPSWLRLQWNRRSQNREFLLENRDPTMPKVYLLVEHTIYYLLLE
jgi:hypothetical protein